MSARYGEGNMGASFFPRLWTRRRSATRRCLGVFLLARASFAAAICRVSAIGPNFCACGTNVTDSIHYRAHWPGRAPGRSLASIQSTAKVCTSAVSSTADVYVLVPAIFAKGGDRETFGRNCTRSIPVRLFRSISRGFLPVPARPGRSTEKRYGLITGTPGGEPRLGGASFFPPFAWQRVALDPCYFRSAGATAKGGLR